MQLTNKKTMTSDIAKYCEILVDLEYIPWHSQETNFFFQSRFSVYKFGNQIFKKKVFLPLIEEIHLLSSGKNIQGQTKLNDLFVFGLRDNCHVSSLKLGPQGPFHSTYFIPLKMRDDLKIFSRNENGLLERLDLRIGEIVEFSTATELYFEWDRRKKDYDFHSFFSMSWI